MQFASYYNVQDLPDGNSFECSNSWVVTSDGLLTSC